MDAAAQTIKLNYGHHYKHLCYCGATLQYLYPFVGFLDVQEAKRRRLRRKLTWTLLDAKGPVGVLGPGVVLQLEGRGVVDERLGALGHARAAVVEVGASLRRGKRKTGSAG